MQLIGAGKTPMKAYGFDGYTYADAGNSGPDGSILARDIKG